MNTKQKIVAVIFGAAIGVGGSYAARVEPVETKPATVSLEAAQASNAAFRDGLYEGKLHAKVEQEPRLSVGRWRTQADRDSFIAGYKQGYAGQSVEQEAELH